MHYLLKTESSVYSFADPQREKTTIWDGVTNPVAVRNLRLYPERAKPEREPCELSGFGVKSKLGLVET